MEVISKLLISPCLKNLSLAIAGFIASIPGVKQLPRF